MASGLSLTRGDSGIARRSDIERMISEWESFLQSEFGDGTRNAYTYGLGKFTGWLDTKGLDFIQAAPVDIRNWRDVLKEDYSAQSVNLWLTAVRRFYAWMIENGATIANPAREIKGARRSGSRHKRDALTSTEVMELLATAEGDSDLDRRDRGILSLMVYAGLRTVEVYRADFENLATRDDRSILWIMGKGHSEADDYIVLNAPCELAIQGWLAARGGEPGPLFQSLSRRSMGQRLSKRSIAHVVKSRMKSVGIVSDRKTTHSLRHSAITNAIRHGATPMAVQAMARHQSFDTTMLYVSEIGRTENPAEDAIVYSNGWELGEDES